MQKFIIILFCCSFFIGRSQTPGGGSAYNFLGLPSTPMLTAAGGVNVSYVTDDVSLSANNPALLNADQHTQLHASFNRFLGGIEAYSVNGAYYIKKYDAVAGAHIYFVDYGGMPQTDAAGNVMGRFHPVDYVLQVSAAKKYLDKWKYGVSLKFISSGYQLYNSSALALDFGVLYSDSTRRFCASALAKNMGFQLKGFAGEPQDLPFDLQIGMTTRLAKAPFGFSVTAQHIQEFSIGYTDADLNDQNSAPSKTSAFDQLFNHFVLAGHIFVGSNLDAIIGYNRLRRTELNIGDAGNGLNGFSMGVNLKFSKLHVSYARSNYQRNISYNQLGLTLQMNRLFGIGEL